MELVILMGIQATGKSTFFAERFADTHIRLNLDMLRTRHRERILFEACLEAKQPVVIDNTNPTREDRARYIGPARQHHFGVVGYYFQSQLQEAMARNAARIGKARIPDAGLRAVYARLEPPARTEGFDELSYVTLNAAPKRGFNVEEWKS